MEPGLEPELEPEPQFGFAASWAEKIFTPPQHWYQQSEFKCQE
jgi:hypothetical protein